MGHAKAGREMEWLVANGDDDLDDDAVDLGEGGNSTCGGGGGGGGCDFLDEILLDDSLTLGIPLLAVIPSVSLDSASTPVGFTSFLFFCFVEALSFLHREISKSSAMYMVMFSVKSDGADKLSSWKLSIGAVNDKGNEYFS